MIVIHGIYPNTEGSRFDHDYFVKHMERAKELHSEYGLVGVTACRGASGIEPESAPPYHTVLSLTFKSPEDLQAAMEANGPELMADIPNYTDVQPIIQVSEAYDL
jgi:uncharacterized protein (TIGR02118 family)